MYYSLYVVGYQEISAVVKLWKLFYLTKVFNNKTGDSLSSLSTPGPNINDISNFDIELFYKTYVIPEYFSTLTLFLF